MPVKYAPTPTVRNRKEALNWAIKVAEAIEEAIMELPDGPGAARKPRAQMATKMRGETVGAVAWCNIDTGTCLYGGAQNGESATKEAVAGAAGRLGGYLKKIRRTFV
jgi:hypothetical protein